MYKFRYLKAIDSEENVYDCITPAQLSSITGRSKEHIYMRIRQFVNIDGKDVRAFDTVNPYPISESDEDKNTGPTFIVMNNKCQDFIDKCLSKPLKR